MRMHLGPMFFHIQQSKPDICCKHPALGYGNFAALSPEADLREGRAEVRAGLPGRDG